MVLAFRSTPLGSRTW